MRILTVFILCLVSGSTFASPFDGTWTGIGKFETTSWGSFSANPVVIEISQNGNVLISTDCWSFLKDETNWRICSTRDLVIRGSELFYMGNKVGTINSNLIAINYSSGGLTIDAIVELRQDGTLDFRFYSQDPAGGVVNTEAFSLTR